MPTLEAGNAAPQTPAQGQAGFSFLSLPGASFYFDLSPEHVYLPQILVMIIKKHGAVRAPVLFSARSKHYRPFLVETFDLPG